MLGASFASFICVFAERGNVKGRSICAGCHKKLKLYELIPIFSYIFLRGKCKDCESIIPVKLFLTEFALGLWFLFTVYNAYTVTGLVLQLILGCLFMYLVVEDLEDMSISAKYLYLFVCIGLLEAIVTFVNTNNFVEIFVPLLIISPFWIIYFWNKNYIGEADPYVFTALGLFFGTQFTVSLFLYSVWIGAAYGVIYLYFVNKKFERGIRIPFLPIIFAASLLIIIFNFHIIKIQDILFIYENFFK